ncbi:hypothetical protein [Desulfospira joergensenii]|uniref:hypothetical protein n=1 Tax=Desulfospira joergensenii TaxID=53329 RepID=UPI0012946BF4|nr:hypothetical protein [Desulfospira joergensenii]
MKTFEFAEHDMGNKCNPGLHPIKDSGNSSFSLRENAQRLHLLGYQGFGYETFLTFAPLGSIKPKIKRSLKEIGE